MLRIMKEATMRYFLALFPLATSQHEGNTYFNLVVLLESSFVVKRIRTENPFFFKSWALWLYLKLED